MGRCLSVSTVDRSNAIATYSKVELLSYAHLTERLRCCSLLILIMKVKLTYVKYPFYCSKSRPQYHTLRRLHLVCELARVKIVIDIEAKIGIVQKDPSRYS